MQFSACSSAARQSIGVERFRQFVRVCDPAEEQFGEDERGVATTSRHTVAERRLTEIKKLRPWLLRNRLGFCGL